MRALIILAVVSAPLVVIAKQPPEAKLFLETKYRSIESLRELPPELAAAFRKHVHDVPVADRGEPFRAGDVRIDDVPPRRFLAAGTSPTGSFVAYEHGGLGHHYHLLLFGPETPEAHRLAYCSGVSIDVPRSPGKRDAKKQALFSQRIQKQIARDLRAGACETTDVNFDF